jgi:uncharacterized protein (DUF58 family)
MVRAEEKLRFGLTEAGRTVVRGTGYVLLAALIVPAFGVLCTLVCVLLTALVVGFLVRPRVRIESRLPDRIVAGRIAWLTCTLTNVGRLPVYNLHVAFGVLPEGIEQIEGRHRVARLAPGETAEAAVAIRPTRRGRYRMGGPVCRSGFPFNLFWFGASRGREETLLVLPAFCRLQMFPRQFSPRAHAAGARVAARIGGSPEYRGNRPFIPGDSPRRIDARAWARLAAPATKEYDEDCDTYTALVLDTRVFEPSGRPKSAQNGALEAAISLCASVAFTINNRCFIDLLLAGAELHSFGDLPREVRLDRVHELLAGMEPSRVEPGEDVIRSAADRFYQMSQAIFIVQRWDDTYRRLYELAERAGCRTAVLLVGNRPSGTPASASPFPIDGACPADVRILSPKEILSERVGAL